MQHLSRFTGVRCVIDVTGACAGSCIAEDEARKTIEKLGKPVLELPFLPDGIDIGALHQLAARIEEQVDP